jgi:hypothetical protein
MAIISIAANLWNDTAFAPDAQGGIRKLQSLGVPTTLDLDIKLKYRFENPAILLEIVTKAISSRSTISFSYDSQSLKERRVNPYKILFWNGFWYLIGMDLDRKEIRLFKLSRLVSGIDISKKRNEFQIPTNFEAAAFLPKSDVAVLHRAKINIRKDSALILRNRGTFIEQDGEYETFELSYENEITFLRELIWYETNIKIIEPVSLQNALLALPITNGARVIDSTPPANIRSASPILMARAAVPTASRPEPQSRLTVPPGTVVGNPASSTAMRATLRLSSPA